MGMLDEILLLAEFDRELIRLRKLLAAGPEEITQIERSLKNTREQRTKLETALREKAAQANQATLDIQSAENEIEENKIKLNNVKNKKEYQILTDRIKFLTAQISKDEEESIKCMVALDKLRDEFKAAQEAVIEKEAKLAAVKNEIEHESEKIRTQGKALREKRVKQAEKINELDPRMMPLYDDAFARSKGDAIAKLSGNICQACFCIVTTNVVHMAMNGNDLKSARCSCGRMLYWLEGVDGK